MMERKETVGCRIPKSKMKEIENLIREHPYLVGKTQFLQIVIQETLKNKTMEQFHEKGVGAGEEKTTITCKITKKQLEEIEQYMLEHPLVETISQFLQGGIDEFINNEKELLEKGVM